jgi:hypothetical protein
LSKSKGRFELNRAGIKAILQSQECQNIAREEASKRGEVTDEYIGTQRAWARGTEDDRDKD